MDNVPAGTDGKEGQADGAQACSLVELFAIALRASGLGSEDERRLLRHAHDVSRDLAAALGRANARLAREEGRQTEEQVCQAQSSLPARSTLNIMKRLPLGSMPEGGAARAAERLQGRVLVYNPPGFKNAPATGDYFLATFNAKGAPQACKAGGRMRLPNFRPAMVGEALAVLEVHPQAIPPGMTLVLLGEEFDYGYVSLPVIAPRQADARSAAERELRVHTFDPDYGILTPDRYCVLLAPRT